MANGQVFVMLMPLTGDIFHYKSISFQMMVLTTKYHTNIETDMAECAY